MSTSKLKELIGAVKIAMFTTIEEGGGLRSRPLATLDIEDEHELRFFTAVDAPKVGEIEHERHVNVAYADPEHQRYVSVSGLARVTQDRAAIHALWKPLHKAWFPEGPDDPAIALIRVRVTGAEYWDSPAGAVVNALGMAKALLTGQRYEPGDNEKLRFDA